MATASGSTELADDERQSLLARPPSSCARYSSFERQPSNMTNYTECSFRPRSASAAESASVRRLLITNSDTAKAQVYESLDYEVCENTLYLQENKKLLRQREGRSAWFAYLCSYFASTKEFLRWFIIFCIGLLTAATACFIVLGVEIVSDFKFSILQSLFDSAFGNQVVINVNPPNLNQTDHHILSRPVQQSNTNGSQQLPPWQAIAVPLLYWMLANAIPTVIGSALVTYMAPVAAGSGIPVIKCYLNGVKVPEVVRIKTYFAKMFGVICSVAGGLCSGKEGPMIHCGSVIAAGISQGKSTTFGKDFALFEHFREDHEKRDFVSAGAAAGVAAAFGAPIGGVLFSLEEGASFWNQILTWRIFFCSLISTFTLNVIISTMNGHAGQLSYAGLINFGKIDQVSYNYFEIPIYILLGVGGGMIGALFNYINYKLTIFRMRYIRARLTKVMEALFVCILTAMIGYAMILNTNDCHSIDRIKPNNFIKYPVRLHCPSGHFSSMGSLFINTPETVLINMLHVDADMYSMSLLLFFFWVYFALAVVTYGLSISSGLFIPALLIGATYGRLVAIVLFDLLKGNAYSDDIEFDLFVTKFALLGAASVLGGTVRMTLSLTVILIETTGNLTVGLPLMICLIFAKWIGDSFNEGIYDIHIKLAKIPFLDCEPHLNHHEVDEYETLFVSQIMSTPVVTLKKIEKVSNIIMILQNETHNGFPVVDLSDENDSTSGEIIEREAQSDLVTATLAANGNGAFYKNYDQNASYTNLMRDFGNLDEAGFTTAQEPSTPGPQRSVSMNTMAGSSSNQNLNQTNGQASNYRVQMKHYQRRRNYGKLRGFVLRWQLIVMLEKKIFNETCETSYPRLNLDIFRDAYPRYPDIQSVICKLTSQEMEYTIDLNHVMNPSPYSVAYNFTFNRTFRLFRALGLRHLCVVDDRNQVVGIITRKDIANFQVLLYKGRKYIQKYSDTINDRLS